MLSLLKRINVPLNFSTFEQHSFKKSRTDVGKMLEAKPERSVQTGSTPFNIFENKGNVESILSECFNQFEF